MMMNTILERAVREVEALPQQDQDRIASVLLMVVQGINIPDEAEEQEWDQLVTSQDSIDWLDREVADIEKEIDAGKALDFDPSNLVK